MNALLQKERAIVTEMPGTTRDVVVDTFQADGIPIQLADTAGMRSSDDPIEQIGIRKTEESIAAAQLILLVLDACDADNPGDVAIYEKLRGKEVLVVFNKSDLVEDRHALPRWFKDEMTSILVSAKHHDNIEALKKQIVAVVIGGDPLSPTEKIVPNLRQKEVLETAQAEIRHALEASRENLTEELIVFHLQCALNSLGTITGEAHRKDMLDTIFERFCIGK
jgi:tRNA modification GTPase